MLSFDSTTNLLMQSKYRYSLQDVAEPNLYREIYDYEHVPKVAFNLRHVPMQMPDEIWMTDTTFRDGQQSVSPFTPEQILHLFKLMSRLGGPKGMVRQSEFFLYTENDQKALHLCQDAGLQFPEITTWIRANEKDFELVKQAGVAETGVLVSCSDYHIFNKMHLTRRQAMDKYLGIVKSALEYGIRPRCHFEDIAPQRTGHHLRPAALCRGPGGTAGMARPQRLLQGGFQRRHRLAARLLQHQLQPAGHR